MGKVAFVFSGQGDQFPGMGKDLAARYPEAAEVFARFDKIRPGTSAQCFQGTEKDLRETRNTQPCLYALETAITAVLGERNLRPQGAAGFSLGEVTAAAAAGIFDQETGFRLVCRRGELMQEAAETADTAMAAVLKLPPDVVEAICRDFPGMYPVNYNCPGQLSVSGRADQMPAFGAAVKAAGGRMIPLKVRAAFHSPYMEQAAKAFSQGSYDAVLSVLPPLDFASAIGKTPLGVVDSFNTRNLQLVNSGTLKFVVGKSSSIVGPAFALMLNAVTGYGAEFRDRGRALQITQGFWMSDSEEDYVEKYTLSSSAAMNAYNFDDLSRVIRIYNPEANLNDLAALAEACSYRAVQARRSERPGA